jgi:hypothetical protein
MSPSGNLSLMRKESYRLVSSICIEAFAVLAFDGSRVEGVWDRHQCPNGFAIESTRYYAAKLGFRFGASQIDLDLFENQRGARLGR